MSGAPATLDGARRPGRPQPRALHDDLMGAVSEAIEGAIGEDGVVEERHPFVHRAIARDDGGGALIPLDADIVEVAGLLGGELSQAEVVEDGDVGDEPATQLAFEGMSARDWSRACRSLATLVKRTRWPARQVLWPRAWANQLLPTPTGPQKITFSRSVSHCRVKSSRTRGRS